MISELKIGQEVFIVVEDIDVIPRMSYSGRKFIIKASVEEFEVKRNSAREHGISIRKIGLKVKFVDTSISIDRSNIFETYDDAKKDLIKRTKDDNIELRGHIADNDKLIKKLTRLKDKK